MDNIIVYTENSKGLIKKEEEGKRGREGRREGGGRKENLLELMKLAGLNYTRLTHKNLLHFFCP